MKTVVVTRMTVILVIVTVNWGGGYNRGLWNFCPYVYAKDDNSLALSIKQTRTDPDTNVTDNVTNPEGKSAKGKWTCNRDNGQTSEETPVVC